LAFCGEAESGFAVKELCRRHGFLGEDFDLACPVIFLAGQQLLPTGTQLRDVGIGRFGMRGARVGNRAGPIDESRHFRRRAALSPH
jgi:hypothetical protein